MEFDKDKIREEALEVMQKEIDEVLAGKKNNTQLIYVSISDIVIYLERLSFEKVSEQFNGSSCLVQYKLDNFLYIIFRDGYYSHCVSFIKT